MTGGRLRLIVHDGNSICDNRQLTKEFQGKKIMDVTKELYHTQSRHYKKLGEEITAIGDIKKDRNSGFQLYIAVIKDNNVLEMGLPFMETGRKRFLNPNNIKIDDLDSLLEHLPEDVELALVWRLDRDMTQDIKIGGNSLTRSVIDSGLEFSLAAKGSGACGPDMDDEVELVADIMEVKIYLGEEDDQIRMSMLMVAPPSVDSWDFSGDFIQSAQPIIVNNQDAGRRDELWTISEFNARSLHEKTKETEMVIPVRTAYPQETTEAGQPAVTAVFVLSEAPKADKIRLEENPIIRLIMNPTERKLWGKLYGFPDEDDRSWPVLETPDPKPAAVKTQALGLQRIPKTEGQIYKKISLPENLKEFTIPQKEKKETKPEIKIRKEKTWATDLVEVMGDSIKPMKIEMPGVEAPEAVHIASETGYASPAKEEPRVSEMGIKTRRPAPKKIKPTRIPKAEKNRKEKTKKRKPKRPLKIETPTKEKHIPEPKAKKKNTKFYAEPASGQMPRAKTKTKTRKKKTVNVMEKPCEEFSVKRRTRAGNSSRRPPG